MNASDRRLSFARIGRLWAAGTDSPGVVAEDITSDLIDAALDSEFEFNPENNWREPDGRAPANYDLRLGKLVETFDRAGQPISQPKLKNFINAARKGFGASEKAARRDIADDILLSVSGLRRWCSRPEFSEWASSRGLSPPAFIGGTVRGATDDAKSPRERLARPVEAANEVEADRPARQVSTAELNKEYRARVDDARRATGRPPTMNQDDAWRRKKGLTRERIRELRNNMLTPEEKKGGPPPKP